MEENEMAEIKTALTSNIVEALKIDSAIYEDPSSSKQLHNQDNLISRESSDPETEENSKMSNQGDNSSDKKKKKMFSNLRKVVSGIASNRKNKNKQDELSADNSGDSNPLKEPRSSAYARTSYSSGFSRMWNTLFPHKNSTEIIIGAEGHLKERSTKTLGRLFHIGNPRTSTDLERPKSTTLGRKMAHHSSTRELEQFNDKNSSGLPVAAAPLNSTPDPASTQAKSDSVPIST
ncbi:uncharacterized protein isoform X2 [Rhodnius prolixus]|uniref:uncharacterized protein isoform X2 n=1 Tax=Rhodnius prolixus TaxID=13249 RepID=UPI003D18F3D5